MQKLNFPGYQFRFQQQGKQVRIFDIVRKKYVTLTPEEWVRQHVLHFLIGEKQVPAGLIGVESEIRLFHTRKRFDVAVFDHSGKAVLAVECKAPSIPVTQEVVDQLVRYNMILKVKFLMLTNGLQHIFCQTGTGEGMYTLIRDLPSFKEMR